MGNADLAGESVVTVYTKPDCVQCDATKRTLNKYEIPFTEIDLTADMDVLDRLKAAGWMRAPIVETADGEMWSGFRPDRIRDLASPKPSRVPNAEWSRSPTTQRRSSGPRL
ncbi:glutaredoxin-like protein NrdH [Bifidobacterium subtile]|jgi:glutaredoxin-like protein NrdH|uniref:glutaredoxin-like protein NrdH n=1 Tax=Bifidobacterium subtile TaxID=77635 RepID=UPI002F35DCDE